MLYIKEKSICSTSWKSQDFTGGAYTSIPVGATQEDIENLAQPLYATPQAMKVSSTSLLPRQLFTF